LAAGSWNCVCPVGTADPAWYLALKPKFALPVSAGLAASAPAGELNQPPPVVKPALGL
jgi:hypothetical protein